MLREAGYDHARFRATQLALPLAAPSGPTLDRLWTLARSSSGLLGVGATRARAVQ